MLIFFKINNLGNFVENSQTLLHWKLVGIALGYIIGIGVNLILILGYRLKYFSFYIPWIIIKSFCILASLSVILSTIVTSLSSDSDIVW